MPVRDRLPWCQRASFGVAMAVQGAAACSSSPPTWNQDVAPILAEHCMSCHRDGGLAPFSLTDYDSASEMAGRMLDQIDRGAMPPFSAQSDADCAPRFGLRDDPRLSDSEKDTLRQWKAGGYPLGEPAKPPPIASQDLPDVNMTLVPAADAGWTTSGERDQFICYLFDAGNTEMTWLTGLQLRPEVSAVVHHALIYAMMPETAEPLVAQFGLGQPFQCGGGLPASTQIHAWFPGTQPLQLPHGMALPLLPGTKIGVQLHYHPHGAVYDADHTAIDLQLSPDPPSLLFVAGMIGNETMAPKLLPGPGDTQDGVPEFIVPKNVPDHPEHMRIPLSGLGGMRVVSVLPHMHLLGTRLTVKLERGSPRRDEPSTECLASSGWNFDWQRNYAYDAAFDDLPMLDDDDTYEIQCTWNNTTTNPFMDRFLAETNQHEPFDVAFGEQTTNEMCLTIAGLAKPADDLSAEGIRRLMTSVRGELGP